MSKFWNHSLGDGAKLRIDKEVLSQYLIQHFEDDVNQAADEAHRVARDAVPKADRAFIGFKNVSETPQAWKRNKDEDSPLLDGLQIPVALVFNDSSYAYIWEYGELPKQSSGNLASIPSRYKTQYQPLLKALRTVGKGNIKKFKDR